LTDSYPRISIIVAVLNGGKTLQRCIDSVVNQTYPYKELIIMDGGSVDNSIDILKANEGNITYWESKPDQGIYHAWNKALDHAHGDWIYFLGADDYLWSTDTLSQMVPHLNAAFLSVRIVYGSVAIVSTDGNILKVHGQPWPQIKKKFLNIMNCIHHQGVFHHRTLFQFHGRFDISFRILGDYEFLLRELKQNDAHFVDDIIVAGFQNTGLSSNPTNELLALRETIIARKKHFGIKGFSLYFSSIYAKSFIKKTLSQTVGIKATNYIVDFYRVITGRPPIWTRQNNQK